MYDLYAPLVKDIDWKVPYEEAKVTVKKSPCRYGEKNTQTPFRKDLTAAG